MPLDLLTSIEPLDVLSGAGLTALGGAIGAAAGRRIGRNDILDEHLRISEGEPRQPDPPLWRVILPALLELVLELLRRPGSSSSKRGSLRLGILAFVGQSMIGGALIGLLAGGGLQPWLLGALAGGASVAAVFGVCEWKVRSDRRAVDAMIDKANEHQARCSSRKSGRALNGVIAVLLVATAVLGLLVAGLIANPSNEHELELELLEHRVDALERSSEEHRGHLEALDFVHEITYPARGRQVDRPRVK